MPVLRVTIVLVLLLWPVYFFSDPPYAFFSPDEAMIKIAFKHSGKRVVECDEADFILREAERYRQLLKESRGVKMDLARTSGCPQERFPVTVELFVDGEQIHRKDYPPTGIRRDMASYIYDRFIIEPGEHRILVKVWDAGPEGPAYVLEETHEIGPGEILLIRFDDKLKGLVME